MATKKCKVCGEKLTKINKYKPKRGHTIGRICYVCYLKQKKSKYEKLTKIDRPVYMKGKYSNKIIEFKNIDAKRDFLRDRRLQCIGCHPKTGHSSRCGQSVEHLIEEETEDGRTIRQYTRTLCIECGGIVRYDNCGFKVCIECGLLASSAPTMENEFRIYRDSYNIPQNEYYGHAGQGSERTA